MDSGDEMIVQMMEDEQAFDDDLREHLSIITSLQNMLYADTEKGCAAEVQRREERGQSLAEDGGAYLAAQ
jgi:hypothetical protein